MQQKNVKKAPRGFFSTLLNLISIIIIGVYVKNWYSPEINTDVRLSLYEEACKDLDLSRKENQRLMFEITDLKRKLGQIHLTNSKKYVDDLDPMTTLGQLSVSEYFFPELISAIEAGIPEEQIVPIIDHLEKVIKEQKTPEALALGKKKWIPRLLKEARDRASKKK